MNQRDTICECNYFDPEANIPTAVADRGGEHAAGCGCALCRSESVTMENPAGTS